MIRESSKIIIALVFCLQYYMLACNNRDTVSPYEEILNRPPYLVYTDSIGKEPKRDDLYFKRAVLLNKDNFPEPALADFQMAWSIKREEKYALGISTILLDKNPTAAVSFLDSALNHIPESRMLMLSLARAYDALENTDKSLEVANSILSKNPEQVDVLKMKASLLDKKSDTAGSIATLEKAYNLAPYDLELNYELSFKYAESKNPRVLNLCDSLMKKDTMGIYAEPSYYKGIYYSNINNKAKALDLFNDAIQKNFYFLNAYIEKGRIIYDDKKYADAYTVFNLAMTISPSFADSYYWMGKCQEAMGQKEEAKLNYMRAFGLDKSFTEARESAEKLK
jgi:tetratricopeptide (TPR) repeat protein